MAATVCTVWILFAVERLTVGVEIVVPREVVG
jgi:hypothetical protein